MPLLERVRRLFDDPNVIYECRRCGTTLPGRSDACGRCGSEEIASFDLG